MATSIANISWSFVPGSLSTLIEYKVHGDPTWIQPTSPMNPTPTNTYPLTITNGVLYDVRLTTNGATCTPSSRTFTIITSECCPPGYTLSDDQTFCYQVNDTTATGPTSPENSVAATNNVYTSCGSYIYSSFLVNGTGPSTQITLTNPFWVNGPGDCGNHTTTDGPLNRSGLWATTTTDNQDIGFGICIPVTETKTYYMAVGCDNFAKINIDGTNIITQDPTAIDAEYSIGGSCFKIWHIYPVVLAGGITHYIELIGHNISSAAGLGAEIYNNTASEIISATSYGDLDLLFSTKDFIGQPIQLGTGGIGYSCPSGYSVVFCDGPPFCRQIITTAPIDCTTTSTTTTTTTTHTTTTTSTTTTTTTTHTTTTTSTSTTTTTTHTTTTTSTTTSSTTTTTTTAGPGIVDITNGTPSGNAVVSNLTVNGIIPAGASGSFPLATGGTATGASAASASATVAVTISSGDAGSITLVDSASNGQCTNVSGPGTYTFAAVVVNGTAHVTIFVQDVGTTC